MKSIRVVLLITILLVTQSNSILAINKVSRVATETHYLINNDSPTQLSLRDAQKICSAYIQQYPTYGDDELKKIEAKTVVRTNEGVTIKGKVTYNGLLFDGHYADFEAKVTVDEYDNIVVNFNYCRTGLLTGGWTTNNKYKVVSIY